MKPLKILFNWFLFLGIVFVAWHFRLYVKAPFVWADDKISELPVMNGLQAALFGLALAFVWVEVLKWGTVKPFSCMKCMTGWLSLAMAFLFHVDFAIFYLPLGVFIGALFSVIKMRYL
ncbi:MAG: hypothetical protein QM791_04180 [Ferruginibacter sp.]